MNKKYIIANWKMELTPEQAVQLAKETQNFIKKTKLKKGFEIVLCPSFTDLQMVNKIITKNKRIQLGAQDVFWFTRGAYTGNIAASSLQHYNVKYAIVGHSERRHYNQETDQHVNKKVKQLLEKNITPIICIGENKEERENGQKESVVMRQLQIALENNWLTEKQHLIIAYEPVWAISSNQGKAVPAEDTNRMHIFIKRQLLEHLPAKIVDEQVSVVYGGSVNQLNVLSFMEQPDIDGVLIGSASQNIDDFSQLLKNINK